MRMLRLSGIAASLLLLLVVSVRWRHGASAPLTPLPISPAAALAGGTPGGIETAAGASAARREVLERFAYAQAWMGPAAPAFAAFRDWTERYRNAAPSARAALEPEGVALARTRRPVMHAMIVQEPQRALANTVPAAVRAFLPANVLAQLETRVAGRGDFALRAVQPSADAGSAPAALRQIAFIGDVTYTAHAYGRREGQITKEGASLHGIALNGDLAVHESPLRVLETDEVPAGAAAERCPVSQLTVGALVADAGVNVGALNVVEAFGRIWELCATSPDMLTAFAQRLEGDEGNSGPKVAELGLVPAVATPATAADASTSFTVGSKRVLVIRVDFSDVPGEPISVSSAQDIMDNGVKPFLENASYGQTTIVTTVSAPVYRLRFPAVIYAGIDGADEVLHADAITAANANYAVSTYDRVIVTFANLGPSRVPGSYITYAGSALVSGSKIWINGAFVMSTLSHELGHTYGLLHSNLWSVTDGNALSTGGRSLEYGDPFDMMGTTSVTGVTRDSRHHYNPWAKNRLGWLPDSGVKTITTSGTYRIYRFDHKDATGLNQPLALRIFRDGVRWYWVGLRQNFSLGTPQANDAYVIWGFNNLQQTALLDLTTPGTNANDADLTLGTTFSDAAYGVKIKPVARGGADPAQYLDLEITVPATPPNVVTAWGREGAYFFSANTGTLTSPVPETYVPMGLTDVQAIAGGDQHALALKFDGTVVGWGLNANGQTSVPFGLSNVASVAAGGNVSGVVRRDGTVQFWGDNTFGQTTLPSGLTSVRQVAIGYNHALALKTDGTVVGWGTNSAGQLTLPSGLTDIVAIAAGRELSILLKRDGTVLHVGHDANLLPAGLTGLTAVSALGASNGGQFAVGLKSDGTVVAWGSNTNGQSTVPSGLTNVVAVAAGAFHTVALKSDGTVVAWGSTASGKLNVPPSLPRVFGVAATGQGSLALVGSPINVTTPPVAQTAIAGATTSLSVAATGAGALSYQWARNGTPIAGATSATLTLSNVQPASAGTYTVVLTSSTASVTSTAVTLTVNVPPAITTAPLAQTVINGNAATFTVVATGTTPVTYQWRKNGAAITGATAATYAIPASGNADGGSYDVLVTNVAGAVTSSAAALTVLPVSRISNLSILTSITPADPLFTIGTVVGGGGTSGTKALLIRAAGPALTALGVGGALADPKLDVLSGQTVVASNDNWGGTVTLSGAFTAVGAFGYAAPTSLDAAVFNAAMPAGSYTIQVSGVGGATGTVIAELYDSTPPSAFTTATPRLINVSVLKQINAGEKLTVGFVIGGATAKPVLIRAIGPTLALPPFNVGSAMTDPKLDLFSGQTVVNSNDNWGGGAALVTASSAVGAFALGNATTKDAVLLATLTSGSYTVEVSGVAGASGLTLIEVYEVP